jgi:uncharacterized protein (DUF4415 family)
MRKGATTSSTVPDLRPGERLVGYGSDGAPLVAGPEWDDPEYGDEARERNPVYRAMHGLPPLAPGEAVEVEPARRKRPITLRLDPDVIAYYSAEAQRCGARSAQAMMDLVLRSSMRREPERTSPAPDREAAG